MPNTHTSPLVSVLMPAYNHASYVRAAVESVLGQTYGNLVPASLLGYRFHTANTLLRGYRSAFWRAGYKRRLMGQFERLGS